MSIFSFIAKAGTWIGGIFKKAEDVTHHIIPKVIEVVNAIKDFDTAHPMIADIITSLIPGTFDDDLKVKIRAIIPKVITELNLVNSDDENGLIIAFSDFLNKLAPRIKGLILHDLAILIATDLADGKLSVSEITGVIESIYQHIAKKD